MSSRTADALSGALLALYVLCGRWAFDRLYVEKGVDESSPLVLELRLWIMAAFVGVALIRRRNPDSKTGRAGFVYTAAAALFFLYMISSSVWSPDGEIAVLKACELVLMFLATLCLQWNLASGGGREFRKWTWTTLFAVTGLLALVGLQKTLSEGPARLAVLGGGPNVFGRMMALLCIASQFLWKRRPTPFFAATSVVAILFVLLSGSRGSLVALALAIGTFFLVERIRLDRILTFGLVLCGLLGIVLAFTDVGKKAVATYEYRVAKLLLAEGYTAGRGDLYAKAYELGMAHPVCGAGLAAFAGLGFGNYPHNMFLEVFSEGGVLGLAALLLVFFAFAKSAWGMRRRLDGATVAAAAFSLGAVQFSGDLYDSRGLFVFMALSLVPKETELS